VIPIAGETRESFNVDELETGRQYRFVLPGPNLSVSEQIQCFDSIAALHPYPSYLVVSGSLPPGVEAPDFSAGIARLATRIGSRLVLDTPMLLQHVPKRGIFMMKPSARELAEMVGHAINSRAEQIGAARSIIREGHAKIIVVSLGAGGALLVTDDAEEHFPAMEVPARSAVGAGDSMVGAIVFALERGWAIKEAVRYGVAAGAAAIMNRGTELCHREDVERLFTLK
jgi:6-phosphofructokinase 2